MVVTSQSLYLNINMDIYKRVQSAYPSRKSQPSSVGFDSKSEKVKQRPVTGGISRTQRLDTQNGPYKTLFDNEALNKTLFDKEALKTLQLPYVINRRPKTGSTTSSRATTTTSTNRKLRTDEIEHLLKSLDRDDSYIVKVECLANYRTLCQTIDLRKTPLDCQLLYALQKRENKIVQYNACRDTRFISLIDSLQPSKYIVNTEIQSA
ncbi:unnamed protein product [Didymodactylos carnosus]|uniref:Uncharacterized protein n=1 Tax=Didymodactylos carnosus TaxID=1234261 RepID=A0A814FG34_9BILA|nr:unnamed protein product [Didymodactylos carnosus]CAF3754900.1 unnamed protein product [Didymodactylos carnosus]